MRIRSILLAGICALAPAAPALADQAPPPGQALSPEVVLGAGLSGVAGVKAARYRVVSALGITSAGSFRVDFGAGPGNKLVLVRHGVLLFRALRFTSMRWAARAVVIAGVGVAGGAQVRFHALVVDGGRRDVFKLAWGGRASVGGPLSHGSIVIH